jgi:predicted trehalose synthase
VKIFIYALLFALLLSVSVGCGIRAWSASTEATYEVTPDGKKITYESNKEQQGLILEINEADGKIHTVKISVDKSSTSEAAIAAALQVQLNLQSQLMRLIDQLAPLAAAAAKSGT